MGQGQRDRQPDAAAGDTAAPSAAADTAGDTAAPSAAADAAGDTAAPSADVVDVPVGRRVMVVSDLLLTTEATASSLALTGELASALDTWLGPGILIIAGNLFDLTGEEDVAVAARATMEAHPRLAASCRRFLDGEDRRILRQEGTHERALGSSPEAWAALAHLGVERVGPVDLRLHTSAGVRTVRVEPGRHAYAEGCTAPETDLDPAVDAKPGAVDGSRAAPSWRVLASQSTSDAPWLTGLHRLSDPSALSRFVTSRTLYRRLSRYAWWMLVPFVVAVLLRVAVTPWVLHHAGSGVAGRALSHAHRADLADQLVVAALVAVAVMVVIAFLLGLLSRRVWSILGGGALVEVRTEAAANDTARDEARRLVGLGYAGLVTAATFQSELTNLGVGFYANVGATAEVVEEERGRLGLPPVFVHRQVASWIELETGAELHVRLLVGRSELPSPNLLERAVAPRRTMQSLHPTIVASYPKGESWPPAPDLRREHRRSRRVRRLSAAAILVAGVVDLLDAVTPPLRYRLHLLLEVLPLRATEAAGALVALAGLALLALGRGILRGQRRAWRISVTLLAGSVLLHLAAGGDIEEIVLAVAVLVLLAVNRRDFQAASDWASLRSAVLFLVGGLAGVVTLATVSIELYTDMGHHHHHPHHPIAWPEALWAACERLVGIRTIALPLHLDRFLAPVLLSVGLAIVAVALFLLSRPVVDRRMTSGRAAELRARDIVRRHGTSTLDYFALRSDKRWFFHRDSLVAYAIYGGICLISPDPIGPYNERAHTWAAFRRFVDAHGWVPAVMGAAEEWLPVYRDSGMHHIYIGDEAVVPVQRFSLAGGEKKGLRQAHNRIAKKGYTASFHDPAHLDRGVADELIALMGLSRRGEHERGFSMMLGRIFDPRDVGLLLTVVRAPDGRPAAMCQFVPASGINGYSLDLMRRDPGDHPNGLLDFALCSTIEYLRDRGYEGLSLNFAAMRSTLAGEKGDGPVQRAERWFLRRLSNFAQIETLWRFNAKYDPDWLSRYVVFDTAEHLVPVIMAIFRAESLWEIPVIGRLLAAGAEKRMAAAQRETEAVLAGNHDALGTGDGALVDSTSPVDDPPVEPVGGRQPTARDKSSR